MHKQLSTIPFWSISQLASVQLQQDVLSYAKLLRRPTKKKDNSKLFA